MKIKTADLTDAALDWAVAQAEADKIKTTTYCRRVWLLWFETWGHLSPAGTDSTEYTPSTDWAQGGPIKERERINTEYRGEGACIAWRSDGPGWHMAGPNELTAAMRCFVASMLGDEVDVPEELCS